MCSQAKIGSLLPSGPTCPPGFGHECYVCAPDSGKAEDLTQLKKYFPHTAVPPCSHYRPQDKEKVGHCYCSSCTNCSSCINCSYYKCYYNVKHL